MRRPNITGLAARTLPAAAVGLAVLGVWWAWTTLADVPTVVFPAPQQVAPTLLDRWDYLAHHLRVTAVEAVVGYLLAIGAGVVGGLLLATTGAAGRGLLALLFAFDALPKLAFAPLLVIWLGWGPTPKIVMAALVGLLPVTFATAAGLARTPAEVVDMARSLSAPRWQLFLKVRLPYALPRILVGVKLAAPLAVIGAVIGEFFAAADGLGYIVRAAGTDTPLAFSALILLGVLSSLLLLTATVAERLVIPWATHIHA